MSNSFYGLSGFIKNQPCKIYAEVFNVGFGVTNLTSKFFLEYYENQIDVLDPEKDREEIKALENRLKIVNVMDMTSEVGLLVSSYRLMTMKKFGRKITDFGSLMFSIPMNLYNVVGRFKKWFS